MMFFNPGPCARYRSRFAQRSLIAVSLLLFAPLVWAAPYAYVANDGSGTVSVIDTATNATVGSPIPVGNNPVAVAVSPDGSRVYVANYGGTVSVIDTATNTVVGSPIAVGSGPQGVAVSPDGSRVYVTSGVSVSVIDTATNTVTATVPVSNNPYGVAVSPDGTRVYVANWGAGTLSVIDTATNTVTATVTVGTEPYGVAVSPDGSQVYVANYVSNTVSVIDTATNTVTATVHVGTNPAGVAVSPDGSRVYVVNNTDYTVSVIDPATAATVASPIFVGIAPYGVAMSPDGSRVYVANEYDSTVSVIDTGTNTVTATVPVGNSPFSLGAFVGPGALIATNSNASAGAGSQISGTVPTLTNSTGCATTDALIQNPAQGTVSFSASTGAFTYTPNSGTYSGPDAFTWQGQAPGCTAVNAPINAVSNTATVSLKLNPLLTGLTNVTLGEGQSTSEAFSLTGSTPFTHKLANSNTTVLPSANLTVSPATCGTAGNLSCTLGITTASVPGTASVTVTMTDKYGDPVTRTVLVTVAAPPTPSGLSNVSVVAGHNGSESFTDTGTGTLTVTATSSNTTLLPNSGITGQSTCTAAGSCTLTLKSAAGQLGTATVTVKVADAYGQSTTGSFTFTVTDTAPTANNGTLTTSTNTAASGTLSATNPDSGQTLTYSIVTQPAHGTVSITNANTGAYIYTPATGYAGSDSFTFKANDGYKDSNVATVSVTVADTPPTAIGASFSTPTNQALSGQLQGNANDTGQALTFALAQAPAHGTVTVNPNGSFSYTPASGYAGSDAFTFTVNDGYLNSTPATVSITVNDTAPTASNSSFSTPVATAYSGQLQASNPNSGQTLTYSIVTQPSHGSISITNANTGAYTYTSNPGYIGSDSFTFKANDGYKDSNTATVSITLTDTAPVAQSASYNVTANSYFSGALKATASSSSLTLTYALVSKPVHGSVSLNASTGAFTYIPNHNYTGTDSFTFKANDGTLDSSTATVTLKVAAGALAAHNGFGGGAFGPWGLALFAALAVLMALVRKKTPLRGSHRKGSAGAAKASALAIGLVLTGSVLFKPTPARAADAGPWYAGVQGNVIKAAGGRNSATAGFKGWTLLFGRHLGTHFALEIDRASYSDYPETLTATANWVNWGLRGLYFPWKSQGTFAPFVLAGLGHQYEYRGDNSEPSNNSASLGLGFTSQPWSAPVAIRADLELQHGFGGGYNDKIFSLGVVFGLGNSD